MRGRSRGRGIPPRVQGASHEGPAPSARGGIPGGGRGRGGGAKANRGARHGKRDISNGLGPNPIRVFKKPFEDVKIDVKITDTKLHSSYSWLEAAAPTIAVPGALELLLLSMFQSLMGRRRLSAGLERQNLAVFRSSRQRTVVR